MTALGRMLLQNLQLMIGRRYEEAKRNLEQPFVSVIMDEFSPFAYENFARILVTARGANVAFLFALQSAPQLLQVGRGFRNDVASAPNTTFMLRIKDEETAQDFLKASSKIRQMRRSMRIRKSGLFQARLQGRRAGQPDGSERHLGPGRAHQAYAYRTDGDAYSRIGYAACCTSMCTSAGQASSGSPELPRICIRSTPVCVRDRGASI